ncbi:hypothetical protein [Anaerobacillus alkalilacustris]|nr:hypothetical protein [Anaerobacillus alkalilacustris]
MVKKNDEKKNEMITLDSQNKDQTVEQDNLDNYYREWEDDRI